MAYALHDQDWHGFLGKTLANVHILSKASPASHLEMVTRQLTLAERSWSRTEVWLQWARMHLWAKVWAWIGPNLTSGFTPWLSPCMIPLPSFLCISKQVSVVVGHLEAQLALALKSLAFHIHLAANSWWELLSAPANFPSPGQGCMNSTFP